jgi:hypothetical protein
MVRLSLLAASQRRLVNRISACFSLDPPLDLS